MRKTGLTHRQIEAATAPAGQRRRVSDFPASALYRAISGAPSEHKSWISRPRVGGRQQTLTHGTFPVVPLQLARERARAVERAIAEGVTDRAALRAIARGADPKHPFGSPLDTVAAAGRLRAPTLAWAGRNWREPGLLAEQSPSANLNICFRLNSLRG